MAKLLTTPFTIFFLAMACHLSVRAQSITENFDDISTLSGNGWVLTNASDPVGFTGWFQGNTGFFDSYTGSANSYIAADFHNVNSLGIISNWLISPNRTFRNGDVITFYTRTFNHDFPDRLQARLSTNGASTNIGSDATTVGDFSTLLLEINSSLAANGYPDSWTMYTITISGLSSPTSGRIGFRYYLTDAGANGTSGNYIGIDAFQYTPYTCPTLTMTPAGTAPFTPGTSLTSGAAGVAYSYTLAQTGALGTPNYAIVGGALPPGLTLSASGVISGTPTATGTFNETIIVSDNSGCSTSGNYSITIVCPPNPINFNPFSLCDNEGSIELTTGSPAGGSYSGTGVSSDYFDPSVGSQNITYDITDPYGCAHSQTTLITVNTAPTVTLTAFDPACIGSADITLSGGSPAGGTYSGTNVSAGLFTPAAEGTSSITYTYTDANGCTSDASADITVNALPQVTATALADVCRGAADVALTGGAPAGGTYSGTNVAGGLFTPATDGTTTITYSYTDANGCSSDATTSITVNVCSSVSESLEVPGLKYFPNPTTGILSVEFDPSFQSGIQIQISDAQGRKMITNTQNAYSRTLDLSAFPDGVYTMELRSGEKTAHYKIVVK